MSLRHEGKFCKVFQVDIQDQVYYRSKYEKIQSKVRGFYQIERINYGKTLLQGLDTPLQWWILHYKIGVIEIEGQIEQPPGFGTLYKEPPMHRRICIGSKGTNGIAYTVT